MSILVKRALGRCQRMIAPFAEQGEAVVDFDTGVIGGERVDLIATDRALYVGPSKGYTIERLAFADIREAGAVNTGSNTIVLTVLFERGGGRGALLVEIRNPRSLSEHLERAVSAPRGGGLWVPPE